MKLGDIIGKKDSAMPQVNPQEEVDKLRKQKEDIERELQTPREPSQAEVMEQQQRILRQQQKIREDFIRSEMLARAQQEAPEEIDIPEEPPTPPMDLLEENTPAQGYKIAVFLDNGQKLPIVFQAHPQELDILMKQIDMGIEAGKVITIGSFKIPGEKILYIDLAGR